MADYTGGLMDQLFSKAKANTQNANEALKMKLDNDNNILDRQQKETQNTRGSWIYAGDGIIANSKTGEIKQVKQNSSQTQTVNMKNFTAQQKEDAQIYGINPTTGLPRTAKEYGEIQANQRLKNNFGNKFDGAIKTPKMDYKRLQGEELKALIEKNKELNKHLYK